MNMSEAQLAAEMICTQINNIWIRILNNHLLVLRIKLLHIWVALNHHLRCSINLCKLLTIQILLKLHNLLFLTHLLLNLELILLYFLRIYGLLVILNILLKLLLVALLVLLKTCQFDIIIWIWWFWWLNLHNGILKFLLVFIGQAFQNFLLCFRRKLKQLIQSQIMFGQDVVYNWLLRILSLNMNIHIGLRHLLLLNLKFKSHLILIFFLKQFFLIEGTRILLIKIKLKLRIIQIFQIDSVFRWLTLVVKMNLFDKQSLLVFLILIFHQIRSLLQEFLHLLIITVIWEVVWQIFLYQPLKIFEILAIWSNNSIYFTV